MKNFAKNYMEQLRYVNKSDGMFIKTSCHDRIAETAIVNQPDEVDENGQKILRIGRIGAFDDIV